MWWARRRGNARSFAAGVGRSSGSGRTDLGHLWEAARGVRRTQRSHGPWRAVHLVYTGSFAAQLGLAETAVGQRGARRVGPGERAADGVRECQDALLVRVTDRSEAQASGACGLPRGLALFGPFRCAPRCRTRTSSRRH